MTKHCDIPTKGKLLGPKQMLKPFELKKDTKIDRVTSEYFKLPARDSKIIKANRVRTTLEPETRRRPRVHAKKSIAEEAYRVAERLMKNDGHNGHKLPLAASLTSGQAPDASVVHASLPPVQRKTAKVTVTPYQQRVYGLLLQIPNGRVTTYKGLADALSSSPRAIGGALRNNPYAPEVPCHRVITSTGFIGGFMGEPGDAPSGVNVPKKLELLRNEGVYFDEQKMLVDRERVLWFGFTT